MSWPFDGRKITLQHPSGPITYVRVSEHDAKALGTFMTIFGTCLVFLSVLGVTASLGDKNTLRILFAEGTEYLALPVVLFAFLVTPVSFRGPIAICFMAVGFVAAIVIGREAFETQDIGSAILALCLWYVALLISFLHLYPYPLWQGLLSAYVFGGSVPLFIGAGIVSSGVSAWLFFSLALLISVAVVLFGMLLHESRRAQHELESANFIRYGD